MTFNEKFCFLFLFCCIKAKITPIIQGLTASGKSYIIKIFAEILGQDLSIYQLNSNSGISLFIGNFIMKDNFDEIIKEKLEKVLKILKIKDINIEFINNEDIKKYIRKIDKKLKSNRLDEKKIKEYRDAKDLLIISQLNRFKHQDSELIVGIKEGRWIVLDGIEMAESQISEKLSSLCGEIPSLNVFESGNEDLNFDISDINPASFKYNYEFLNFNTSNIHPNFQLFITYNHSSHNSERISQSLFNKCIKFTLPQIDLNPSDTTTMLYQNIITNSKYKDLSLMSYLCAGIAKYHIEEVKKSKDNSDLLTGNMPFTSRNLCFILNDFHRTFENNKNINIESWLQNIFDNYYWRSYINYTQIEKTTFMENALSVIKSIPDKQYIIDKELDYNEEFKEIIEILIKIQKYAIMNIEYKEFDFKIFLDNCLEVPINKEKLTYIYNNLDDTILLLDNNNNMNQLLKNEFYQINFIKNNYENILDNSDKVSGFIDEIKLNSNLLLKNKDIIKYLLRLRFLNEILQKKESKNFYEPNLNYSIFTSYSNMLSQKLLDLIKYKTRNYFEELVLFLCENPETFKIIHYFYPYNNNELKSDNSELKFANYYIYIWHNLYIRKYNFSVRLKDQRYDITFPEEEQDRKVNPYFILNEKNSLNLSKNSFIKLNIKIPIVNKYKYKFFYNDNSSEGITEYMIQLIMNNLNDLYKESLLKNFKEIDNLQLESYNFFTNNSSTLISRIISLLINLSDKFSNILNYMKEAFCFLERDAIEIFEFLYDNLEKYNLNNIIINMIDQSFFCESESKSMLWKYRILLDNLELENKDKIDNNIYYDYFNSKNINVDDEISLINIEINNINKFNIYWDEDKIEIYKSKLLTLMNLMTSYKKNIKDAEINK